MARGLAILSQLGATPPEAAGAEGVNEGVTALLQFIRRCPGLRTPQIAKAMGIPGKTVERWLKKLREENLIEFTGSSKTGGYRAKHGEVGGVIGGVLAE